MEHVIRGGGLCDSMASFCGLLSCRRRVRLTELMDSHRLVSIHERDRLVRIRNNHFKVVSGYVPSKWMLFEVAGTGGGRRAVHRNLLQQSTARDEIVVSCE